MSTRSGFGMRRVRTWIAVVPLSIAAGVTVPVAAEVAAEESGAGTNSSRVPIGLVLAGGGARGAAHIGALKVLEEMRVPVDYIAGTSMGSIVGALYAIGYSPAEMEEILGRIDWEDVFRDRPDRRLLSFRSKADDRLALFPFEIGVGRGGRASKGGIITASKVEFVFQTVTLEAAGVAHFDDLPIPYRAVAADLETGDAVVLERGNLAEAMRASMSIPGVFTPVVIDGRILVDGGIADNLPINVTRRMGAKRVIAIDVGTPPKTSARTLSPAGVLNQTLSVVTEKIVKEQRESLGAEDLIITPDLEGVSAASFDKIAFAVADGEAAARRHVEDLKRFSVSEEAYAAFLQKQRRGETSLLPAVRVDEIEIRGVPGLDPSVLTRRMKTKVGQTLDPTTLQEDLWRINLVGEFEKVGFRLEPDGERNRLVVEARRRSWGPGYLRMGIHLETNFDGDSEFALLGHYRRPHLNRLGAEWKTLVSIGDPAALATEFYQPLEPTGLWFVAPSARWEQEKDEVVLPTGDLEIVKTSRLEGAVDLGMQLRNYGELRLGYVAGRRSANPDTTSSFDDIDADIGGARFQFRLDQVNNVFFPTSGNATILDVFASRESLGAEEDYDRLSLSTLQALTFRRNSFLVGLQAGTDLGSDLPLYDQFRLGGFLNLSGFRRGALSGDVMGLFSLIDFVRVGDLGGLGHLYAGLAWQAGNAWDDSEDVGLGDLVHSGTLFFGVDNRLTPVYVGYGQAEGGEGEFYLFVGRPF